MCKYILNRSASLLPLLLGITILAFGVLHLSSTDALDMLAQQNGGSLSPEALATMRSELGLDLPLYEQYLRWLGKFLSGNAGTSFLSGTSVSELFLEKLPTTLLLTISALGLSIAIALPTGLYCALQQSKLTHNFLHLLAFIGSSIPSFCVAFFLMYFLAIKLQLLPITGSSHSLSLLLPTLALALPITAKYILHISAEVSRELDAPYVLASRLRGIPERIILQRFVLRSALPTLLNLVALSLGSLLGGSAIIESIFMLDGVGKLALDAITMRDTPIVLFFVLWNAFIYTIVNTLVDIAQHYLDPKLRKEVNA